MPRLSKIGAAALAAFGWTAGASVSASALVVAGGGSGAKDVVNGTATGGGGAGEVISASSVSLNPTLSYTITVGAGGASQTSGRTNGNAGSNSSLGSLIIANGGGYGACYFNVGGSGGSGGGGSGDAGTGSGGKAGGSSTTGTLGGGTHYGNAGGTGSTSAEGCGGGGGAGAVGANGSGNNSGAGGAGTANSITGSSVTYGGGGGGGGFSGSAGAGGSGGGGAGGASGANGTNGTANLGGGGGGAGSAVGSVGNSGSGGSGVVIISYLAPQKFGGGVVTTSGSNVIHTFNTSGTLTPLSALTASALVVAGGGGGGYNYHTISTGGGGGAGGYRTISGLTIDANSTYLVTVGAGGVGAPNTSTNGGTGTDSAFSSITSAGGGYGATNQQNGGAGGSGGGASGPNGTSPTSYAGGAGNTPSTSPVQGYAGGDATRFGGGGGGGSSAVGANASTGLGGAGTANSISGTSVTYATGGGSVNAAGGSGTGDGGGRGTSGANNPGYAGGSGVVIISYAGSTQQMAGGTVTITGGNVIHTFTSSGYLTPIKYVNNSLRFRSSASAYLSRTPSVASNRTTWTWSGWVKRGVLSSRQFIFGQGSSTVGSPNTTITFESGDTLCVQDWNGSSNDFNLISSAIYRDPAAWYHIVVAFDTTQTTSTNRIKVYVNGSQVTSFGTSSYPSLNFAAGVNTTSLSTIGRDPNGSPYADLYEAEINFIDGQALTPNSFGTFNSYGVWQPITYGGSYGTNGFYLPFNVDKTRYSYAFNTTPSYLTSSTAGIMPLGNTTWSIECWTWCNVVPTANVSFITNTASGGIQIFYRPAINTVEIGAYGVADVAPASVTVNNLILNAWNHFVFTSNGTQLRIFANGILIGYLSSSYSFAASQGTVYIGTNDTTSSQTLNGFISNLRVCNGSIPTSYQTSSTTIGASIFTPPTTALTTTSQGAANVTLLTCQSSTIVDNSSSPKTLVMTGTVSPSNIGFNSNPFYDQSPNGNNWIPNNISLVNGSTCDSMTDVPTLTSATAANYCVLNPLDRNSSGTILDGNLATSSQTASPLGTIGLTTGKWYFEASFSSITGASSQVEVGIQATNIQGYLNNGNKDLDTTQSAYGATYTTGDIIGCAFDLDAKQMTFYKNGTSQGSFTYTVADTYFPMFRARGTTTFAGTINFGQQPFVYTPPTGYVRLNTYNL